MKQNGEEGFECLGFDDGDGKETKRRSLNFSSKSSSGLSKRVKREKSKTRSRKGGDGDGDVVLRVVEACCVFEVCNSFFFPFLWLKGLVKRFAGGGWVSVELGLG